ncbi:Uncharacterised protein [Mycobacteroides abscessus subsp. abscessus]|nr:Uncharacterised protein [Mycobacteroides abscessus subsp. abscessus]
MPESVSAPVCALGASSRSSSSSDSVVSPTGSAVASSSTTSTSTGSSASTFFSGRTLRTAMALTARAASLSSSLGSLAITPVDSSSSSSSSSSMSSRRKSGSLRWPAAGPVRRSSLAAFPFRTRVARATSLVRLTTSRLLISIGTRTNSHSTTSPIHNTDWGMLGISACSFLRALRASTSKPQVKARLAIYARYEARRYQLHTCNSTGASITGPNSHISLSNLTANRCLLPRKPRKRLRSAPARAGTRVRPSWRCRNVPASRRQTPAPLRRSSPPASGPARHRRRRGSA